MNLSARISYIKGLAEGLNLDENKDEVKVLNEIIDFLGQLADEVEELEEWYFNFCTCFKCSRLSSICSCIALDTWLRVSNAEVCLNRHFSQEDRTIAGISNNLYDITFLLISIISHFF